ncbi:MAG: hypothetical protein Q8P39_01040 [Candidatus Yanofskybacteria bacterium]|nr:hypothetical protein [Candidatus Yanofskybacteria bacterium]
MAKQSVAAPIIRTIYLYLFALVGLVLIIISGVRFIDMALKAFVFTQVEQEERLWDRAPYPAFSLERVAKDTNGTLEQKEEIALTDEEKEFLAQWIVQYNEWQERSARIDPVVVRRQREASNSLAMALVGFPLYLYHWRVIQRQRREEL